MNSPVTPTEPTALASAAGQRLGLANKNLVSSRPAARTFRARQRTEHDTMGLFDGVLGGVIGAGMAGMVNDVIEKHGGIQGIIGQFQANGLGPTVQSWVGTGANQAITPDQVQQGLGPEALSALATKLGIPQNELTAKLAEVLPQAIDHLTPGGAVPPR
jgi:uncharacterized protein YidB (DUF937 family)